MMNTRKLTGKTLKVVKDGVNAAFSHHHSVLQGNIYKAVEQVEATSNALRCSTSGMESKKQCGHLENETGPGTTFLSKVPLPYQQKSWSLPLNVNQTHTPYTMANCSTAEVVLPVSPQFTSGITTSSLRPIYGKNLMTQQRRMMSTRAVNANRGTIEGIITTLNDKFNADIVNDTQAIYQFNILSGDRREIYYIDLRNGSGSAGKGKSEGNPDTIFSIDAENFNRLVEGNLRAPTAYTTGRMKISGSMQKAAKLEKLFATLLDK